MYFFWGSGEVRFPQFFLAGQCQMANIAGEDLRVERYRPFDSHNERLILAAAQRLNVPIWLSFCI
jgi:hypothetical protein